MQNGEAYYTHARENGYRRLSSERPNDVVVSRESLPRHRQGQRRSVLVSGYTVTL